jgi:hydrogenase nickel incorporation protein HypA/HybF
MHEMSIAMQIIQQLEEIAARNNVIRIDEVEVEVGVMQQVVPEALHLSFSSATEGTVAENAKLIISEEPMTAECGDCGCEFSPTLEDFTCPRCKQASARITSGNSITLKSIVCQTPEENAAS